MTYTIQGKKGDWEVVIGLEVHAQIISDAKLFSGAATELKCKRKKEVEEKLLREEGQKVEKSCLLKLSF